MNSVDAKTRATIKSLQPNSNGGLIGRRSHFLVRHIYAFHFSGKQISSTGFLGGPPFPSSGG